MASIRDRMRSGTSVRVAGIDVRVHWTFLVLLAWLFASHVLAGHGVLVAAEGVALTVTVFACVVLHELGHALTARRFGVRTRDITLYPIGGVARLQRIPERPREELWIAVAGPAVSFAIAGLLWLVIDGLPRPDKLSLVGGSFLGKVMYVNLSIGLFNLLPAFPMDGGRVLRALLAMRMTYVRATQVAASAGQSVAVLLGIAGLFVNPFLLFIALFVFVAARQEAMLAQTRAVLQGVPVTEAMMTRFQTIEADAPLSPAVSLLLSSEQQDFPVMRAGQIAGMLTRADLVRALARNQPDLTVTAVMTPVCEAADASEMLDTAFRRMQESDCSSLPVTRDGVLIGFITLEHVGRWLMVRDAMGRAPDHGAQAAA